MSGPWAEPGVWLYLHGLALVVIIVGIWRIGNILDERLPRG